MKTKILEFNVNWDSIKRACMRTIGKEAGKTPSDEWKRKLLICRHSPIRKGVITWKWQEIPYAISTHFVRHHIGCEKYVSTSREDRTGIPRNQRSQMDYVSMEMDANIEALLNISERRLCTCADATTREYWLDLKEQIKKYDKNIAWAMLPSGIVHGGCTEPFSSCKLCDKIIASMPIEDRNDIMKRYDYYEEYTKKNKKMI